MTIALVQHQATIGLNEEALAEWEAYRAEDLKKPLTPRAKRMVEKKLLQWSESEQMRIVEHAIEHCWRGLYWVEPPRQVTTRMSSIRDDLTDTSRAN